MKSAFSKKLFLSVFLIAAALLAGCSAEKVEEPAASSVPLPTLVTPNATAIVLSPTTAPPQNTAPPLPVSTATRPPQAETVPETAAFISETFPDNSVLDAGKAFTKSFELKNTGSTTWTTAYALVLESNAQDETFDSPPQINFPQNVPPGGKITLEIPLTAPTSPGTYTTYWAVQNDYGQTIYVDGFQHVWAKIIVCASGQTCAPAPITGSTTSANNISASLKNVTFNDQITTVDFCMNLPDRQYNPSSAQAVSLQVDGQNIVAPSGGTQGVHCYQFVFPLTKSQAEQAESISLSIAQVRLLGGVKDPVGNCEAAKPALIARYPGLDFTCVLTMGSYYSNLKVPANLTREEANLIINDAIEKAINGPWVIKIK